MQNNLDNGVVEEEKMESDVKIFETIPIESFIKRPLQWRMMFYLKSIMVSIKTLFR
jgi:hypothetical protein